MTELPLTANPFALMLDPQAVMQALEALQQRSPNHLRGRIYRPLDKPLIAHSPGATAEFDRAVEESFESE